MRIRTVPVPGLLLTAGCGTGEQSVQSVDGSATRLGAVETGLFAAGRAEITGDVTEGRQTGVPS
ncbi:MAG TPA: hypothetical protein VN408_10035 [Actinoplanes sp.]|nr:hypothetical protein [Actinoplanes sp.]